jgi:hypothetical protein
MAIIRTIGRELGTRILSAHLAHVISISFYFFQMAAKRRITNAKAPVCTVGRIKCSYF